MQVSCDALLLCAKGPNKITDGRSMEFFRYVARMNQHSTKTIESAASTRAYCTAELVTTDAAEHQAAEELLVIPSVCTSM